MHKSRWIGLWLVLIQPTFATEILIDGALHPLGESLRAFEQLPAGASAMNPVPACVVVHGSGGLFREETLATWQLPATALASVATLLLFWRAARRGARMEA